VGFRGEAPIGDLGHFFHYRLKQLADIVHRNDQNSKISAQNDPLILDQSVSRCGANKRHFAGLSLSNLMPGVATDLNPFASPFINGAQNYISTRS